jgi:hypothetical protein
MWKAPAAWGWRLREKHRVRNLPAWGLEGSYDDNTRDMVRKSRRALAGVVLAILLVLFAANAGRLLVVDSPAPSDVILVLAGETEHRPARALEMLSQGYGRRVVIDVPAAVTIYGLSQMDLAEKYVQALPQRGSIDICPIEGLSTRDEAHDAEKCLAREQGNRILIVTSDFHTRRALNIFRHELRDKTFTVTGAHDDAQFGTRWWTHREWAKTCLEEWMRTVWWMAVDRWR